jgi:sterol desaturase/sphingolipid hydroxylase (fatty acid hydroxylase superfamily)
MIDIVIYAIPAFILLLAVEWFSYRELGHDHDEHGNDLPGYEKRDTATSLSMGLGNVFINVGWKGVVVIVYAALYELSPLRMPADLWWTWIVLFFADDLAYYWFHRAHHEIRLFWASHVVHHSSEHYNLSTALRQTWTPMTSLPFWMPLALMGFAPWQILLAQSWSLLYQFWIHTERVDKLPRWFEKVFNTPSHHRVHHGSQEQYLDRNHGGILIVWDSLFGTYEPEGERVRYGLTKNIETFNPVKVAFGEFVAIWRDVKGAKRWRHRLGYVFRGPGWSPREEEPARRIGATWTPEPPQPASRSAAP